MLVPIFEMINAKLPLSTYTPWFYCFLVVSSFLTYLYCNVYFQLFFVVIFDVRRQETMAQLLRAMIRLTDLDPEIRELLAAMQSVDLSQLAQDNVQAVFSVSKDFSDSVSIRHTGNEEVAIGSSNFPYISSLIKVSNKNQHYFLTL